MDLIVLPSGGPMHEFNEAMVEVAGAVGDGTPHLLQPG